MDTVEKMKELVDNKIWVTKKVRMEAELDRKNKNKRLNYLLIYYSGCLSLMSFLNLYSPQGFNISLWASMISLLLPCANIFQYKAGYIEEAVEFRECYLKLDSLEKEINLSLIDKDISKEEAKNFQSKYDNILNEYQNHADFDYMRFSISQKNNKDFDYKLRKADERKVGRKKFVSFSFLLIATIFPIVLIGLKIAGLDMYK